jgi:hypothetical protein
MRLPLAELLSSQRAKMLAEHVRAAAYVEPSQIAGVPCDHLALRGDQADLQLWVAQGNQPLPRRLVITYTPQVQGVVAVCEDFLRRQGSSIGPKAYRQRLPVAAKVRHQ